MSVMEAVRQANRPGPPEHSIAFRVAATGAVVVAIAACWTQGELSAAVAGPSIALVTAGNLLSYHRRARPVRFLKPVLAVAVIVAFGWFFVTVSATASSGDLTSVEGPLAVLFTMIQVTHAFDVPSRRDLGFSLAGSATLMAVAAAQAVDGTFGIYVLVWAVLGFAGLLAMWASMAGGARNRVRAVTAAVGASGAVAVVVLAALPAPHANSSLVLPSSIAADLPVAGAAGLVGGGPHGAEPVHAGSPSGRTGVGGFLGFAGPLDTADRATLGTQVVFRVRADRPTFWIAETFDDWTGRSWAESQPPKGLPQWREVNTGSPFPIPPPVGQSGRGTPDYQTFYLSEAGPNLVFHAANAEEVWFPARRMYVSPYGTIRSSTSMGPGSIYTVLSKVQRPDAVELASVARAGPDDLRGLSPSVRAQSLQLPHPYPRVARLAARVTAHAPSVYAKVVALEDWIGAHTKYTLDIPPLAPGQDTVDQFLFGSRRGYCEQISTSLAVMLRTLGIPAREATGYVPGPYNPITDLYDVQADDAHAWVQVWFPGYGWQSFDPTAYVPLANPSPAAALGHDLASAARRIPEVPALAVLAVLAGALATALVVRRRRRAPATWAGAITKALEDAARRAGLAVDPGESLVALGTRLDARWPPGSGPPPPGGRALAEAAERAAYGAREPDASTRRSLLAAARRLRRAARRLRRPPSGDRHPPSDGISRAGGAPGPPPSSPRRPAGVGSP